MNEKVKQHIIKMVGKSVIAKINIGRNKFEYIEGIITKAYPFLFIIQSKNETKSFSYADVLTKTVIIKLV